MNYQPYNIPDFEDIHSQYIIDRENMIQWVKQQPSHYQYLKDNIYSHDK